MAGEFVTLSRLESIHHLLVAHKLCDSSYAGAARAVGAARGGHLEFRTVTSSRNIVSIYLCAMLLFYVLGLDMSHVTLIKGTAAAAAAM